jgi:hypothetical protein
LHCPMDFAALSPSYTNRRLPARPTSMPKSAHSSLGAAPAGAGHAARALGRRQGSANKFMQLAQAKLLCRGH